MIKEAVFQEKVNTTILDFLVRSTLNKWIYQKDKKTCPSFIYSLQSMVYLSS